jgi:hypothetical protein
MIPNGYSPAMVFISKNMCYLFRSSAVIKKKNNGLVRDRCYCKGNTLLINPKSGSYEFREVGFDLL